MAVADRSTPGTDSPYPCYYCGVGEDSVEHVYGECPVVRTARLRLGEEVGCTFGHGLEVTMLAFPVLDNKAVAASIVCFNWAVWSERTDHILAMDSLPDSSSSVNRILQLARGKLPVTGTGVPKGEEEVAALATHPPGDATIIFTDGSAIPNPGPCGAGFVMRLPGEEAPITRSIPLGFGDNNKGEIAAIVEALQELELRLDAREIEEGSRALLFSDSNLCIAHLVKGWAFPTWTDLAHGARALYRRLRRRLKITLYWIRGHRGIPGNDEADAAAKAAAQAAKEALEGGGDLRPP
jgi:ribonuclease HI